MSAQYLIRCTRHCYADDYARHSRVVYLGLHGDDSSAPLIPFSTKDAAVAAIKAEESQTYYLRNGEHSRPTLTAVPVKCADRWTRDRVGYGF